MKTFKALCIASVALVAAACQGSMTAPLHTSSGMARQHMSEFGPARAPIGHVGFCRRQPAECGPLRGAASQTVSMSEARWNALNAINKHVNRTVQPATDQELYHTAEYWTLPTHAGDCEDYLLEKRRILIADGWPESALLATVVRDEIGEGHAVLTVVTDMGDLILDNKTDLIRSWSDTPYIYYKRQSRHDPKQWTALLPAAREPHIITTNRRSHSP